MNPVLMAALISGGINALQGKRGSDLLKSTVRDTAIAYALGPGMTGSGAQTEGINQIAQQATEQGTKQAATQLSAAEISKQAGKTAAERNMLKELAQEEAQGGKLSRAFKAIETPFRDPVSGDISKFRVGLGAAGLGATAFGLGAFDPKPAPDPKYAGYNRFYAADPEMFQPFSGKEIDYSKYPEGAPYSGLQEGGMAEQQMMSPDDEMLEYDMQQQTGDGAGIVGNLMERFRESLKDPEQMARASKAMMRRPARFAQTMDTSTVPETMETPTPAAPMSDKLPARIQREFVMKFQQDPDRTAIEYATMMRDTDRLTIADVKRAKETLEKLSDETEMDISDLQGIMGLAPQDGSNVRIPEPPNAPEAIQQLMDTFRSRASNEPAQPQFNKGDLVDVLPSKYKRDENDESNYKRTSGKMVTDETGKGSGNKDTMLAQLADGEFVTKAKSVLGAGKAMGGKNKKEQRELGAKFFYKQMSELEKIAESA
jgi:phosphotransferase system HPr-like phosphotransfer protein